MTTIRRLFTALLFAMLFAPAQASSLCRWNDPDCIQIRITPVAAEKTRMHVQNLPQAFDAYHYVVGLLDGSMESRDGAGAALYNASRPMIGHIKLIDRPEGYWVMTWFVNPAIKGSGRISTYGASVPGRVFPAMRGQVPSPPAGYYAPEEAFRFDATPGQNGSEAGLNLLRNYFALDGVPDEQVIMLICSDTSIYPDRRKEMGIGITAGQWRRLVQGSIVHVAFLY